MPSITGLRADIVPHWQWATRKWFDAEPLWYYHRAGTDEEIVANRKFYQLVDPDLRELCRLLNDHGLHTTPSCQGHFYPRDRFERIWEQLTREAPRIAGEGLVVKDSETDRQFLFRESGFVLPWDSFDSFYAQAADHQGTGYLGIVVPEDRPGLISQLCGLSGKRGIISMGFDERISQALDGRLYNIVVRPANDDERIRGWSQITHDFDLLLHRIPPDHGAAPAESCDRSASLWSK